MPKSIDVIAPTTTPQAAIPSIEDIKNQVNSLCANVFSVYAIKELEEGVWYFIFGSEDSKIWFEFYVYPDGIIHVRGRNGNEGVEGRLKIFTIKESAEDK